MLSNFIAQLDILEDLLWTFFGVPLVIALGIFLTYKSRCFQLRYFTQIFRTFFGFFKRSSIDDGKKVGVPPLRAFFAAVGGCVGIGNIVGICTAVQLGGPGALFWIWVTAFVGMMIKYSEIYLGLKYRVKDDKGSYSGGPMYFLKKAYKLPWISTVVAGLLCVYGVEVYQFSVISESISTNFNVNPLLVILTLLALIVFAGSGGVRRVGAISSRILPVFVVVYVSMGLWVLLNNFMVIPSVLQMVFESAFTGHAAVGGFVGAGVMATISYGMRRGCYTGDVGIGYASVIHSESSVEVIEKQASLAIVDMFLDTFIVCTTSLMLILSTNVWQQPMEAGMLVQTALANYFPYMNVFMPLFLFLLGYNTINAYFCVGLKCAHYISPTRGRTVYYLYAVSALLIFPFLGTAEAQTVMAIAGVSLLLINGVAIFNLRHELSFDLPKESVPSTVQNLDEITALD